MTDHWRCPACGIFDGPVSLGRCDVCVDERDELVDVEAWVRSSGSAAQNHEADAHEIEMRAAHGMSPQGEDHGRVVDPEITAEERRARESKMLAPQGEDHEAGIETAARAMFDFHHGGAGDYDPNFAWADLDDSARDYWRQLAEAGLSRCPSPERNTEKLVERIVEELCDPPSMRGDGGFEMGWRAAIRAVAEFGSVVPADEKADTDG